MPDRSYYSASSNEILRISPAHILGELVKHHNFTVDDLQRNAWLFEIDHLRQLAGELTGAHFFIEFVIPRMGKRADVVVIYRGVVFVLEYKVGHGSFAKQMSEQVLDYALDLKNFHQGSHDRHIVPVVVATGASPDYATLYRWSDRVAKPLHANCGSLLQLIKVASDDIDSSTIDAVTWANSPYKPTPTIIQAAQALYRGHDVREISRSEAGAENLTQTAHYIDQVIADAKRQSRKAICFITGVPGSGKTLAGLNIASERMRAHEDEHAVFLSGNGPLVDVLREALAADELIQGQIFGEKRVSKRDALRHAGAFIQNIHHFRDDNLRSAAPPVERVVVFDEAQRAWTRDQASKFMREKRGVADFAQSEPEYLISVMDRHSGWCVIVCLVGEGQEINTGEAGIAGWLAALDTRFEDWSIHASNRLLKGNTEFGTRLIASPHLHLGVSIRSFRAETVSDFISAVIDGDEAKAQGHGGVLTEYSLAITRDLETARSWLRSQARGSERYGLVASSNALRLKPVGIHVKSEIDPPVWFLADRSDVRSSFALEDAATEFDVQGLELDWVCLCWDANLRWVEDHWEHFNFRGTRWETIRDQSRIGFLKNAYRVLLTRARQGMIVFVPHGSLDDRTRLQSYYDGTYKFLRRCGFSEI